MYDGQSLKPDGAKAVSPAVIDTGSSNIAISDDMFKTLVEKW